MPTTISRPMQTKGLQRSVRAPQTPVPGVLRGPQVHDGRIWQSRHPSGSGAATALGGGWHWPGMVGAVAQVRAKKQRLILKAPLKGAVASPASPATEERGCFHISKNFHVSFMHSEPQCVQKFEKCLSLLLRMDAPAYIGMYHC